MGFGVGGAFVVTAQAGNLYTYRPVFRNLPHRNYACLISTPLLRLFCCRFQPELLQYILERLSCVLFSVLITLQDEPLLLADTSLESKLKFPKCHLPNSIEKEALRK